MYIYIYIYIYYIYIYTTCEYQPLSVDRTSPACRRWPWAPATRTAGQTAPARWRRPFANYVCIRTHIYIYIYIYV